MKHVKRYLIYIVPAGFILMLLFLNLFFLEHWLDSDMAAEMIFSKTLADQGHLFASTDWFYSTEFRVLYTQLVMTPLFHVFKDWHLIRLVTNMVFYVLLLGSYFFMIKPLKPVRKWAVITAGILLLPFSETLMLHMHMGNTYLSHVLLVFLSMGLFLRLVQLESIRNRKGAVTLAVYMLLSVICGMSGVRYLLALYCPLVVAAVFYAGKGNAFLQLREQITTFRLKQVLAGEKGRYVLYGVAGSAAAAAGYCLNAVWIAKAYSFQTYEATNFISIYQGILTDRIRDAFGSILMLLGYIPDKGFLSLRGMISLFSFAMLGVGIFVTVRNRKRERQEKDGKNTIERCHRSFIRIFLVSAFLINTFIFIFTTSTLVPRYYITVFVFFLPVLLVYLEEERFQLDRWLVTAILGAGLLLGTAKTVYSLMSTDKNADKREVAEFLTEEGYEFGYSTYWNGNIITELTNGRVEIANIANPDQMNFFRWSSPGKYYESGYYEGKPFLLLTVQEAEEFVDAPAVREGERVYEDAFYIVYRYEDTGEFIKYVQE